MTLQNLQKERRRLAKKVIAAEYYLKNKAYLLEQTGRYKREHREEVNARNRAYKQNHPEFRKHLNRKNRLRERVQKGRFLERIWERDKGICQICHRSVSKANRSLDHIVPVSLKGDHSVGNLQLAHRVCNSRRGAGKTPGQLRLALA